MRIVVNGKQSDAADGLTVEQALQQSVDDCRYAAVAVNGVFVPRAIHKDTVLRDGDRLEVLQPAQGG